mmetsp:Transcript_8085/g.13924  ORF Transcript_8085/g.13924 Transcript_8085/m.13924 type:complete len:247 (-) Transcript_8085:65-805(-)
MTHDVEAMAQTFGTQQDSIHCVQCRPIALTIVQHQRKVDALLSGQVLELQELLRIVQSGMSSILFTRSIPTHQDIWALSFHLHRKLQIFPDLGGISEADAGTNELHCQVRRRNMQTVNLLLEHVHRSSSSIFTTIEVEESALVMEEVNTELQVCYVVGQEFLGSCNKVLLHRLSVSEESRQANKNVCKLLPNLWRGQALILFMDRQQLQQLRSEAFLSTELMCWEEAWWLHLSRVEECQGTHGQSL